MNNVPVESRKVFHNSVPPLPTFVFFLLSLPRCPLSLGRRGVIVPVNFEFLIDTTHQVKDLFVVGQYTFSYLLDGRIP